MRKTLPPSLGRRQLVGLVAITGFFLSFPPAEHSQKAHEAAAIHEASFFAGTDATLRLPRQDEVESRTINSTTTLLAVLPDGRRTYALDTSVGPIHYKDDLADPDEPWKAIDANIRPSGRADYEFQNEENFFKSYFREQSRETDLVQYRVGNRFISYTLHDNELGPLRATKGRPEGNRFVYPEAYPGVDVRYSVYSERLLEEFVLSSYRPVERLSQQIHFEGAYFEAQEDGSYKFYDEDTHEELWTIARPVMYEAGQPDVRSYGLHFELSCEDGNTCSLVKVLDDEGKAWLSDEARVFPLVIDATVDRDIAAGSDDYGKYYGLTNPLIMFGGVSGYSANYGQGFRFTNITIPQGSTVTSANLSIVDDNGGWIGIEVRLTAIDEDNTPTFSGGNLPGSRPITSAFIAAETPNISRAVGERVSYPTTAFLQQTLGNAINAVVNRPGWSSGNALAVVNNSDQDPGAVVNFGRDEYRAYEYGSPATNGPKLHIVYTAAVTPLYRSVGTRTTALATGAGNALTIAGATATFSSPLPGNVGVGDAIQYDSDGNGSIDAIAFIHGRTSSTVYTVRNASGTAAAPVVGDNDWSVFRAYTSLSNWQAQTENASLNGAVSDFDTSTDLVTPFTSMNVACYDDGPMDDMVFVSGWTTAAANYVRVFTPTSSSEVGVSQRHDGTAGTGFRLAPVADGGGTSRFGIFRLNTPFVRIEGLEIDGSGVTATQGVRGIFVTDGLTNVGDIRIDSCIIHDLHTTADGWATEGSMGILDFQQTTATGPPLRISNNLIYDITNNQNVGHIAGIHVGSRGTSYVYNNTILNINNPGGGSSGGPAWGIYAKAWPNGTGTATVIATNNFVGNVTAPQDPVHVCYGVMENSTLTQSNNVSSDATAAGPGSQTAKTAYATYFRNAASGSEDLHLRSDSLTLWGSNGADLDADANLPITTDIDGGARDASTPDIGADEFAAGPASRLYRSVGVTATNLNTGARTVTISGSTATFSGAMPDNVGVGDALTYNSGGNQLAFIHGRTSSTVYTVKSAVGGTPTAAPGGTAVGVYRSYTALKSWESQVENPNINEPTENDTNPSTDLVTTNAVLMVACYGDGEDVGSVYLNGWTTGSNNFIEIYTPFSLSEVGTSQRHNGTWDPSAYRLTQDGSYFAALGIKERYVRVEGLQLTSNVAVSNESNGLQISEGNGDAPVEIQVSGNIIRSTTAPVPDVGYGIGALNGFGLTTFDSSLYVVKVWNNIIYGYAGVTTGTGIYAQDYGTLYLYNNTLIGTGATQRGIARYDNTVIYAKNNISIDSLDPYQGTFDASSTNNFSDLGDAPGLAPKTRNGAGADPIFVGGVDYHLDPSDTWARDQGADLSGDPGLPFASDIDLGGRQVPWDIGADDVLATTAVELVSFSATAGDRSVTLDWETGSEIKNLGFHLYRATSRQGPFERITTKMVPGLGSSPAGARYRYRDEGLVNGRSYYYELEDIETTGATKRHGPVSAMPSESASATIPPGDAAPSTLITYGEPSANSLRVLARDRRGLVLELVTKGFYAEPLEDGSVRLEVPGFETLADASAAAVPVKRTWVDAVAGHEVDLVSAQELSVEPFTGLHVSGAETSEIAASRTGSVRAARRRARGAFRGGRLSLSPPAAASVTSVGFQGETKKALLELAPLRWDEANERLLLAGRLVVRLSFAKPDPMERSTDGVRGRRYMARRSFDRRSVLTRFRTTERGLYAVRYEEVSRGRRAFPTRELRLSRQGETVPYFLDPATDAYGPGSFMYFWSDGARVNPYGSEAVYELEVGAPGEVMEDVSAPPYGASVPFHWHRSEWEENRYYQAALVDAPDLWLWDPLFAPERKGYSFEVTGLDSSARATAQLSVWLQGASDSPAEPDHHIRVYVNGTPQGETSWDGKRAEAIVVDLPAGTLQEGANHLELENVGDTGAPYSMVMLDRYALEYPHRLEAEQGRLEGRFDESGTAELSGLAAGTIILDRSEEKPRRLVASQVGTDGLLRFHVESGKSYLAVRPDAVQHPVVVPVLSQSHLKSPDHRADYLVIAPEAFLPAASPLLAMRRSEGLKVEAVSIEAIFSEFGFGESTPQAVKDFLVYAYQYGSPPSPRYVLLIGDATYDFKNFLGTGVRNQVPPLIVRTSYLWTASDPSYAAVNGDDLLPDLAIGRLPAASVEEAEAMVEKIVDYERDSVGAQRGAVVVVADNPDRAGDFETDALAAGLLASDYPRTIFLSELGAAATHDAILQSFDEGASLVSYVGHGGIQLWADENFFNTSDVASLRPQSRKPLLLTMNCLNGYFHFPYFDSLAEELVKARDKGAIAAFSPSGLSLNEPAQRFHRALLRELFHGDHQRLGDAVMAAQAAYSETGAMPELLTIYQLFGDPALRLR